MADELMDLLTDAGAVIASGVSQVAAGISWVEDGIAALMPESRDDHRPTEPTKELEGKEEVEIVWGESAEG